MQPPFDDFQPILDAKPARVDVLVNGNKPLKHGLQVISLTQLGFCGGGQG
jgi:hypothetical protein